MHKIIHRYTITNFLKTLFSLTAILLAIIVLFDSIELLRRAAKNDMLPFATILKMALFKLPETGQEVLPFAILLSTIMSFWALTKKQELVIYRSVGLSAWQFIMPVSVAGFIFGLFFLGIINPISAFMTQKYERMENLHLGTEQKLVTISKNGLWLKQKNHTKIKGASTENIIFHTQKINLNDWTMSNIMVLFTDDDNRFIQRIDAKSAKLENGYWILYNAYVNEGPAQSLLQEEYILKTKLTREDIIESFSDPKSISFWALPAYIKLMQESGISTRAIRMHYYSLMTQPLFFAVIIMLAASLCLKPPRFQNTLQLLILTIIAAFSLFFLSSLLKALGSSEQLPVLLAAWTPSILTLLAAINIIMIQEDG